MRLGRQRWDPGRRGRTEADQFSLTTAAGDARLAIGILRPAASKTDRENLERITGDILLDAAEDARAQINREDCE